MRPTLSPKWPNTMPPSGRATKATALVTRASRVALSGSKVGKNSLPNTSDAAVL
ncbi:hypothetical protein [Nonomuraea dietziae]|uniref:hypothetical protein n=1 Tax=Nonomuraea dietziae TaxID=65515 RepID=UPI003CD0AE37